MAATPMTPLDPAKTERYRVRSGRLEISEATSADGRWRYVRLEMPGTPWEVADTVAQAADPEDYRPEWLSSLPAARRWTAGQPAAMTV